MIEKEQIKKLKALLLTRRLNDDYEPMSNESIADATGISVDEISKSVEAGLANLKKKGITEEMLFEYAKKSRELRRQSND